MQLRRTSGPDGERAGRGPSWTEAVAALREEPALADALSEAVAGCPWPACFWEVAPAEPGDTDRPFEMVVVEARGLARVAPEPEVFAREVARHGGPDGVATFPNLGGDAVLVVPAEDADTGKGAHLAVFLRGASPARRRALWRAVGEAAAAELARPRGPLWLSTSGMGVAWLHVRLDSTPKYYTHAPFRAAP